MSEIYTKETIETIKRNIEHSKKLENVGGHRSFDEVKDGLSEKELEIYENANLELDNINGKDVLTKTDIDYNEMDAFGDTNLERMEMGKPPLIDGEPVELHHLEQRSDGPLAELTRSEHRGPENNGILHDRTKESEINRQEFKNEREEHWKARSSEIKNES